MSSYFPAQTTFDRGEIAPELLARFDIEYWRSSTALCTNFLVMRHGGLRRRSGTIYITEVKDSSKVHRLLPFVFNASQAYVAIMGDLNTRFLAERGVLGAPYEIVSPYAEADLFDLQNVQSADKMYIAHADTPPNTLQRNGDTDWSYDEVEFEDGPFLEENDTDTTVTVSATANIAPNRASIIGTGGNNKGTAALTVDDKNSTYWRNGDESTVISIDMGVGNDVAVNILSLTAIGRNASEMPSTFKLSGSTDDITYISLVSREEEVGWSGGETRHFPFTNETAYRYYQLEATTGSTVNDNISIAEIRLKETADTMAAVTFTFSSTTGINDDAGFTSTDVGRHVRLQGSDGDWRWTKILSVGGTKTFTGKIYGPALPDLDPTTNWRLGSWSEDNGYPTSACFFQERLCWAGTAEQPLTVWGSKSGAFEDHGTSIPLVDDDAIDITMQSSQVNQVRWIAEDEDILIGSAGSIRTIGPADRTTAFSATNVEQRRHTTYGSAGVTPARAGNTTVFVGRAERNLRELLYDPAANGYIAPDLSILSQHLFKSGVVDMAWQQDPTPTLWVANGDGELIAVTYDREQKILGFARHEIAGTGAMVESVAVIPSTNGYDDLYMIVKRTINGGTKRYVEVLEREYDADLTTREDGIFLDSALTYDGTPITTVTGLSHLEGEAISVLRDGVVEEGLTVSSGQVTMSASASKVVAGLPYESKAITLPVAGPGRDGALFGRSLTNIACYADLMDTGDIYVGTDVAGTEYLERPSDPEGGEDIWDDNDLKSGVFRCDFEGSWKERGQVIMQTDKPLPVTVRALIFQQEMEP